MRDHESSHVIHLSIVPVCEQVGEHILDHSQAGGLILVSYVRGYESCCGKFVVLAKEIDSIRLVRR